MAYAEGMLWKTVYLLSIAFPAMVGWMVYGRSAALVAGASIGLLVAGVAAWTAAKRRHRPDAFHDHAISTLVFPPESRFGRAGIPPR